ncbi:MAG TPA: RNA 2',3'-cyclic phosphodiesterase [Bacillota bacterium]|jgi:2'-5' RNA ligase|nr:RNA 2',3'-cyclic phosphodiesterase [Bacillota bacterium]
MKGDRLIMRLFIAIDPSAEQKTSLQSLLRRLSGSLDGVTWVRPEGLHLTLKFLGEQEEGILPDIIASMDKAAASMAPFNLQFGGAGVFPSPRRARVIWSGIRAGAEEVSYLASLLEKALAEKGFPVEKRSFIPHLTLGRLRRPQPGERIERLLDEESSFATEPAKVRSMRLYESHLSSRGARYTIVKEILFGKNRGK